jgi:hypothetical protein
VSYASLAYTVQKLTTEREQHGILTVGETIESAVAWFHVLERCDNEMNVVQLAFFLFLDSCRACQTQLLSEAAVAGTGSKPIVINDEEAAFTFKQIGNER